MKPLLMAHQNIAKVEAGILTIDRKFHVGMLSYVRDISTPILSVHPESQGQQIMDPVKEPIANLPYKIMTFKVDGSGRLLGHEVQRLTGVIANSQLVYGDGLSAPLIAQKIGIRFIPILEYDLHTRTTVATADVRNPMRRAIRIVRTALSYRKSMQELRHAHSLHCNGYPIYEATKPYNRNSLLFFDSRMSKEMIISSADLSARLAKRAGPLQLLYSGRYERMKGTLDAVIAAEHCLRRGLDVQMHCYGQGSLKADLIRLANKSGGRIIIHDAVSYIELVRISQKFDVFICCHIQNDPSCTYLESFGAGLPIVGYANRMWQRLCEESGAGMASPLGSPAKVAASIERLILEPGLLAELSWKALAFAQAHCYENEWDRRISALNAAIDDQQPQFALNSKR